MSDKIITQEQRERYARHLEEIAHAIRNPANEILHVKIELERPSGELHADDRPPTPGRDVYVDLHIEILLPPR